MSFAKGVNIDDKTIAEGAASQTDFHNSKKDKKITLHQKIYSKHDGIGPFNEVNLPGVWFYKMPHKVCNY